MSSTKKFNLIAAGRAYTDVITHVSADFLTAHNIPYDGQRECSLPELKKIQQALTQAQLTPGGPGANTAAVITTSGGKAGYFGKVFNDEAGIAFLQDFTQRGVELCCPALVTTPAMSATCLVLLTDQHRSFAYNPGCADYFSVKDFAGFDFATTDFFLIEAHLLTSAIANPAITVAIEFAQGNCAVVINLQGITDWQGFEKTLETINTKADVIIGNQQEQAAFAKAITTTARPSQLVVTTKGIDGAHISLMGKIFAEAPAVTTDNFVSANGAGDAFIAGFLLGLSKDASMEESMYLGTLTATAILEETGARPPL